MHLCALVCTFAQLQPLYCTVSDKFDFDYSKRRNIESAGGCKRLPSGWHTSAAARPKAQLPAIKIHDRYSQIHKYTTDSHKYTNT